MRTLTVLGLVGLLGALGPVAATATARAAAGSARPAGLVCDPQGCDDAQAPALVRMATPGTVRLVATGATVRVSAVLADTSGVREASVDVFDGGGDYVDTYPLSREAGAAGGPQTWGAQIGLGPDAVPGGWRLDLDVTDVRDHWTWYEAAGSFPVALDTQLDFDAAPERPLPSGAIAVAGQLRRLVPFQDHLPYAGATVLLSFRPAGSTRYGEVGRAVTAADGRYRARFSAARGDGTWRASFAGADGYAARTSRSDTIDVR